MNACTKLFGEAGLGAKFYGANASGLVTEWTVGANFGSDDGALDACFANEGTIEKFGLFLGKLGQTKKLLDMDQQAQAVAVTSLTEHPFNWRDPRTTFTSTYKERFCGWPNVACLKAQLFNEYEELLKLPALPSDNPGAQPVFVHSDCHPGKFLVRPNGDFVAIDLERASVQPAAHMLCNFAWVISIRMGDKHSHG